MFLGSSDQLADFLEIFRRDGSHMLVSLSRLRLANQVAKDNVKFAFYEPERLGLVV